jgi:hypothetical protein
VHLLDQAVENPDMVAVTEQGLGEMAAYEPGATGNEYSLHEILD